MAQDHELQWIRIDDRSHACNLPNGILVRSIHSHPDGVALALCFVPDLVVTRVLGSHFGQMKPRPRDYENA